MAKIDDMFPMPEPKVAVRNGDALLEFHQGTERVGQLNISKIFRSWWASVKASENKGLKVVP